MSMSSLRCCFGICCCCCKDNYAELDASSSGEEFRNTTGGIGRGSGNPRNFSVVGGESESLLSERKGNRFEIFNRRRNRYGSADKQANTNGGTPNLLGSMNGKKSFGSTKERRFTFSGNVVREHNDNGSSEHLIEEPKAEEQRLLDQIVEETAASMIDVNGFNCGSLSRSQTRLKSQWYNQRLNCIHASGIVTMLKPKQQLLLELLNTKKSRSYVKSLHQQVISQKDVNLMSWAANEIADGLKSIRIEEYRKEAFVIPFPLLIENHVNEQQGPSRSESY